MQFLIRVYGMLTQYVSDNYAMPYVKKTRDHLNLGDFVIIT